MFPFISKEQNCKTYGAVYLLWIADIGFVAKNEKKLASALQRVFERVKT